MQVGHMYYFYLDASSQQNVTYQQKEGYNTAADTLSDFKLCMGVVIKAEKDELGVGRLDVAMHSQLPHFLVLTDEMSNQFWCILTDSWSYFCLHAGSRNNIVFGSVHLCVCLYLFVCLSVCLTVQNTEILRIRSCFKLAVIYVIMNHWSDFGDVWFFESFTLTVTFVFFV